MEQFRHQNGWFLLHERVGSYCADHVSQCILRVAVPSVVQVEYRHQNIENGLDYGPSCTTRIFL